MLKRMTVFFCIWITSLATFALDYDPESEGPYATQFPTVTVIGKRLIENYTFVDSWWTTQWKLRIPRDTWIDYVADYETERAGYGTDVRLLCAIPGRSALAHTKSTDDFYGRRDAVSAMVGLFATKWAASLAWSRLTGSAITLSDNTVAIAAEFTYSDGGTETWYVNPMLTNNAQPVPNTLKLGDGVEKRVPC